MIGGNINMQLQIRSAQKNAIGEQGNSWQTIQTIKGFLDLQAGDSKYTNFNQKLQESTHVFVADYVDLDSRIKAENSRAIIGGKKYDVMLLDDPMGMHLQLEIFLKYTGAQNG